jgi:hypothetical protein
MTESADAATTPDLWRDRGHPTLRVFCRLQGATAPMGMVGCGGARTIGAQSNILPASMPTRPRAKARER